MKTTSLVVLLSFFGVIAASLRGYTVVKYNVTSSEARKKLEGLHESGIVDIWSFDSRAVLGINDVMVRKSFMQGLGISGDVMISDVQELIDQESATYQSMKADPTADWYASYHTYDELIAQLEVLANNYPDLLEYTPSIGKTIQGRNIPAIKITNPNKNANKRIYYIQAGQHAREWVGPASTFYVISQLLEGAKNSTKDLLDNFQFVIVPIINGDGYTWSWTNYRLWRKNRRQVTSTVFGVDLNRNWDNHWSEEGSSKVPSSDTYCGTKPFSEPETTAVSNYITSLGEMPVAIDVHSYSQLILRPWGWSTQKPADYTQLFAWGAKMASAIKATHGKIYENIAAADLYPASGGAEDWFYASGYKASYTFELRDTGAYGFVLPANQIIPNGQELFNALVVLANSV